jgi:hypothetical protein
MRISFKHLLIGMSLGAIVVLIYGYNILKPQVDEQIQPPHKEFVLEEEKDSLGEIIKPEVTTYLNSDIKTRVQFLVLYKFDHDTLESEKEIPSPTTSPKQPTPTQNQITITTPITGQKNNTNQNPYSGAPGDVVGLIEKYASEYGVNKDMMIGIAKCESGFRENAVNGPYAGIYQFVSGTWISNRRAMGLDENLDLRYNAEESVKTAAFKMSRDGFGAWPVCQHKAKNLLVINTEGI